MKKLTLIVACGALIASSVHAETKVKKENPFHDQFRVPTTSVKNQKRSGTCWCFSTISFFETEYLRKTGDTIDLSEMSIVRNVYPEKANLYMVNHGKANFSQGGQSHDVLKAMVKYGVTPESIYLGNLYDPGNLNHTEMEAALNGLLSEVNKARSLTPNATWKMAVEAVLNTYMGEIPKTFNFKGKAYTPQSFVTDAMGIDPLDYVEITSYNSHPFYQPYALEIPDNWTHDNYYNIPIDELMSIMDEGLKAGYTFAWDGDVSGKEFSRDNAIANIADTLNTDDDARLQAYNSRATTDDHLMHIVGIAEKDGEKFYITKNSWSKDWGYDGYLYMSEDYVRLNTVAIMIHKEAIPKAIAKKMNL